jgi:hypothetical protein
MDPNFYRFRSKWRCAVSRDDVYLALARLDDYPVWWPQIARSERLDDRTFSMTARSALPYELVFTTTQRRRDPEAGVLEADLDGDLRGFSRWTVTAEGSGTLAVFEEEVVAEKALLRRLAPVARPAFRANHAVMMRDGRRGLAIYAAGLRRGREAGPQAGARP